jgi:cation diffusion facilitator family transporter
MEMGEAAERDRVAGGSRRASQLVWASVVISAPLAACLTAIYVFTQSQIALAQAADSVQDVVTAIGLLWALRISVRPPDASHPFGHQGAQPVAALIVAVLAALLGFEVLGKAITALLNDQHAGLGWPIVAVLTVKVVAKGVLVTLALRQNRRRSSSALHAFAVDARNDVIVGVSSIVGVFAVRFTGISSLDAWLAIPVALWIAVSGFLLGLESTRLLMGAAPAPRRQAQLRTVADKVAGVESVGDLRARFQGDDLHVWVEVRVDPDISVRAAHDIGEAVERVLQGESDVCDVFAHVDVAKTTSASEPVLW